MEGFPPSPAPRDGAAKGSALKPLVSIPGTVKTTCLQKSRFYRRFKAGGWNLC